LVCGFPVTIYSEGDRTMPKWFSTFLTESLDPWMYQIEHQFQTSQTRQGDHIPNNYERHIQQLIEEETKTYTPSEYMKTLIGLDPKFGEELETFTEGTKLMRELLDELGVTRALMWGLISPQEFGGILPGQTQLNQYGYPQLDRYGNEITIPFEWGPTWALRTAAESIRQGYPATESPYDTTTSRSYTGILWYEEYWKLLNSAKRRGLKYWYRKTRNHKQNFFTLLNYLKRRRILQNWTTKNGTILIKYINPKLRKLRGAIYYAPK